MKRGRGENNGDGRGDKRKRGADATRSNDGGCDRAGVDVAGGAADAEETAMGEAGNLPSPPSLPNRVTFAERDARVKLSDDALVVSGFKGYRSARSSHAVPTGSGAWFCEMLVEQLSTSSNHTEVGHLRLGWASGSARIDAPVGFCKTGYGFRSMDGSKVHDALRETYATNECLVQGDTLGMLIHVGTSDNGTSSKRKRRGSIGVNPPARKTSAESTSTEANVVGEKPEIEGSFVQFFRNGKDLGVAFRNLARPVFALGAPAGGGGDGTDTASVTAATKTLNPCGYFAMASVYQDAAVRLNPGPNFKFFPPDIKCRPLSDALTP